MSENERLRALLAEARAAVGDYECIDCGIGSQDLWGRIDAALAEPVEPPSEGAVRFGCGDNSCVFKALSPGGMGTNGGCRCFKDLEAWLDGEKRWNRPEVRRVEQAARMLSQRVYMAERERDEARAEVERAYRRGAEAMREAAAACVGSDTALLQTYRSVLEGRIRDLPVPEDKP